MRRSTGKSCRDLRPDKQGYRIVSARGKSYRLNRLTFWRAHGWLPNIVDHIDLDRSNDHIDNLRAADPKGSSQNRAQRPTKSGHRGVIHHKRNLTKPFQVQLRVDGKLKSFGYYMTAEEAGRIAEETLRELHGEFYRPPE